MSPRGTYVTYNDGHRNVTSTLGTCPSGVDGDVYGDSERVLLNRFIMSEHILTSFFLLSHRPNMTSTYPIKTTYMMTSRCDMDVCLQFPCWNGPSLL